ncbi:cellulose biosynthesis protein BcsG [Aeromonas caviae]|nr:cellulose biosynthesis protein BcsG [Aeromonas caviae]MDX7685283.1 cellulose biosynthesis protein BcsG [Aeromonas caviae]MDX7730007.1 cellulose biosynthesis protein BcsG [Aeromonas caviae]
MLWGGYLNFHPLINLVFAAFLIFPLPRAGWRRARHWLALPVGGGDLLSRYLVAGDREHSCPGQPGLLLHPGLLG